MEFESGFYALINSMFPDNNFSDLDSFKKYLEEHNFGKYLSLGGDLPTYLHNIDKQADEIYEVMYKNLSAKPENKKTEDFLKNVQIENSIQKEIEEVILNELVYVE